MQRLVFPAMGTRIDCLVEPDEGARPGAALQLVQEEFRRLEELLSRFLPGSQLSRLNRDGALDDAAPELVECVRLALEARERTGGRFDPTIHDAIVACGYDRSFEEVEDADDAPPPAAGRCGGAVRVDAACRRVELGAGTRLDLGGIAKGYAVDRACDLLATAGPCIVNAGGDLATRGEPPEGTWRIGIETATGSRQLTFEGGAIATSGRDARRWRRGGVEQHHLIDPRTGRPAATDLLRVTVVAGTAVEAEVLAKALLVAGEADAVREADGLGVPALLVTADGRTVAAGGLAHEG
ncbi:MAG: FAD:protein FMN transferase [Thermoleophilia bacterium]